MRTHKVCALPFVSGNPLMSNQVERSVSNESSFVAVPIPSEESDREGLADEAGDERGAPRASASRGPVYQQTTTSVLVDSLPEFPRLWTRMILDAEQGAFVPPLIQEHDFGVLVDADFEADRAHLVAAPSGGTHGGIPLFLLGYALTRLGAASQR